MTSNTTYTNVWEAICENPEDAAKALALSEALMYVKEQSQLFDPVIASSATHEYISQGRISHLTMRTLIGFCSNNKIDTKPLIAICKKYNQPIPKIQLNVALDYDGCANADVPAFLSIVATMQNFGHKVYIVTMRYPSECRSILEEFGTFVDGIIPTSRHSKREACESLGIKIHIWMDDTPLAVEKSAGDIWGEVTPEGCIRSIDHTSGETGETKVEPLTNFSMLMIPVFDPTNVSLVIRG